MARRFGSCCPGGSAPAPAARAIGTLEEAERYHILDALEQTRWRISGEQGRLASSA